MKKTLFLLLFASVLCAQVSFDQYFEKKSLRLDFFHTGDKNSEIISFDKCLVEPYYAGSLKNLIDTFEYGNYFFKVFDKESGKVIYSRGFSTLYQEWQTTEEAKSVKKSFSGSISFPYPKSSVKVEIYRRDRKNNFVKIFEHAVNPKDYFISPERRAEFPNFKVHYSGDPSQKLDIVFIPEGYTKEQMEDFKKDCERCAGYLFNYSPFKEHKDKINIWGVEASSEEPETDIPGKNVWKKTVLNSNFYTFDSERYLMTADYHKVKDVAANAPYDQIYILVNTSKYGGGAIYNFYSMTAAKNNMAKQILVHEFAHGLAGIADEYEGDTSYQDMYPPDVEPWEVNITTLVNFDKKWKNLLEKDTPIPTPKTAENKDKLGVYEGGGYVSKGVFRPTMDSMMNTFRATDFNIVCKKAMEQVLLFYAE